MDVDEKDRGGWGRDGFSRHGEQKLVPTKEMEPEGLHHGQQ